METYWDAYLSDIRDGKITKLVVDNEAENITHVEIVTLNDWTPRQLLEGFYCWLGEKGRLVH